MRYWLPVLLVVLSNCAVAADASIKYFKCEDFPQYKTARGAEFIVDEDDSTIAFLPEFNYKNKYRVDGPFITVGGDDELFAFRLNIYTLEYSLKNTMFGDSIS